jgi:hypothetical protein
VLAATARAATARRRTGQRRIPDPLTARPAFLEARKGMCEVPAMARRLLVLSIGLICAACASVPPPLTRSRLSPAHPEAPEAVAAPFDPLMAAAAVAPAPAASPAGHGEAGAATVYTCTMHPEVEASQPGACPVCGMALQPRPAEGRR